jgi:hypothetical protein
MTNSQMPGPSVGYSDIIDEEARKRLKAESEEPQGDFYPLRPSAMGDCSRALAHKLMEYEGKATYPRSPISPELDRIFKFGHLIEGLMIRELRAVEYFKVRYTQQVVDFFKVGPDDKLIEGSVDVVIYAPDTRGVLDVKSKKDNWSSWSKTSWTEADEKFSNMKSVVKKTNKLFYIDDLDAFLEECPDIWLKPNFLQLNLYANSEFLTQRKVDHGSVLQVNKNDCKIRELRFRPSKTVYEKCRDKYDVIARAVAQNDPTLAPKDFWLGSGKCSDCQFAKLCWPGKDPLKEFFATWPEREWPDDSTPELETLYSQYKDLQNSEKECERIQKLIAMTLEANQIKKVKFKDGAIFELRALKGDGLVIRRTKK